MTPYKMTVKLMTTYKPIQFGCVLGVGLSRGESVEARPDGIILVGVVLAVVLLQVTPHMVHLASTVVLLRILSS